MLAAVNYSFAFKVHYMAMYTVLHEDVGEPSGVYNNAVPLKRHVLHHMSLQQFASTCRIAPAARSLHTIRGRFGVGGVSAGLKLWSRTTARRWLSWRRAERARASSRYNMTPRSCTRKQLYLKLLICHMSMLSHRTEQDADYSVLLHSVSQLRKASCRFSALFSAAHVCTWAVL